MWAILSMIAVVALFVYSRSRNGVWGAATIGLIGGFIAASIFFLMGTGFHWSIVGKWVVAGTLLGLVTEAAYSAFRLVQRRHERKDGDR